MERRTALKSVAAALGGLAALPAWANGWSPASVPPVAGYLSPRQETLLADIAETIVPKTDTPGAKELGVAAFIQAIVADCRDAKTQALLANGLQATETAAQKAFGKPFAAGDAYQRTALLTGFGSGADAELKAFYKLVKDLTIHGYLTTEYVMTNLTHFEMAPGYYRGCVPVGQK